MKTIIGLLTIFGTFISSVNSQIVIQDSVFTTTLDLGGPTWDNATIKNCTFKNTILSDGLRIANANNISIDSCIFYNIQGNGIRLHSSGISDGIIIKNCTFDSIYGNGILSAEQHINTQILNNYFIWIGLDTVGASQGAPHHGIYFQGNNFLISGNRISNIYNDNGNCISVRSNGVVRNNVLFNATKNGITYYSDHPSVENTLLIENNIIYECTRGVSVSNGGEQYVDTTIIRFNTLITDNKMCIAIKPGLEMVIEIYGNILIRTDDSNNYIWAQSPYDSTKNVLSSGDIGFVDFANHDYHISDQSVAYNLATGLAYFLSFDFENDPRYCSRLDAGADQFSNTTDLYSIDNVGVSVYPNPAYTRIHIDLPSTEKFQIVISNLSGENILVKQNQDIIDISNIPNGIYIITIKQGQRKYLKKLIKL